MDIEEKESMRNCASTETEITVADLKKGDIVLYELKKKPEFIKPFKENLEANFYILIDKLICFAEGSMITHSAIMYDEKNVVEATIPTVRIFKLIFPDYYLHIRRVKDGVDGSKVLEYLPQTPDELDESPESYAMMMAVVAGLSCLFKAKVRNHDNLAKLAAIVRGVLYKAAKYLDSKKLPYSSGDNNWFCSQLVYYTYAKAAAELGPEYEIAIDNVATPLDDTLIHAVIKCAQGNCLTDEKLLLKKPVDDDELFAMAEDFFNPDKNEAICTEADRKPSQEDGSFILTFINMLCNKKLDFSNLEQEMIKFQSAFVMPSDLCGCLEQGFRINHE